jgi:putative phosphoesterase
MKIGVVSDTHRNKEYLKKVVEWLIKRHKISLLVHLGDDYSDVMELNERYIEVLQVPGIYDDEYKNKSAPATIVETIQGLDIVLVHSLEKDLTREDAQRADIILYGHTHHPEIKLKEGMLSMNPGHLKNAMDKNITPTFGLLDIQDKNVNVKIIDLDFKVVQEIALLRSGSGLFKV